MSAKSPILHRDATLDTLMRAPAEAPISRAALDNLVRSQTNVVSVDVLQQALHHQEIDAHNAAIDKKKAERQQLRELAQAGTHPHGHAEEDAGASMSRVFSFCSMGRPLWRRLFRAVCHCSRSHPAARG